MVENHGAEHVGKVRADRVDGHSAPTAVPQGPRPLPPSAPSGTLGRVGNAVKGAFGSPILDAGQAAIAGMRLTTGWDDPDRGDPFGHGAARFTRAGEAVNSASPGEDWNGAGAQAYETVNRRQVSRAQSMAMLDRSAQTVIAREAYQITYHREKLDDQSNYLGDLSYLTWPLGLAPGAGKAMKAAVELSAVSAALSICSAELYQLSQETSENAAELTELVGQYSGLTRKTAPLDLDDVLPLRSSGEPRPAPTGKPGWGQPTPTPIPGPPPTISQSPGPVSPHTGARVPAPSSDPVVVPAIGGAVGPGESATASALPTEMMSGMASAFGAVGGMIGSVVAPLAAALTGAAGAAGQSLSTLTSADVADVAKEPSGPGIDEPQPDTVLDDDPARPGSPAGVGEGGGTVPAQAAESQELQTHPPDTSEAAHPPVPPAATRPPQ